MSLRQKIYSNVYFICCYAFYGLLCKWKWVYYRVICIYCPYGFCWPCRLIAFWFNLTAARQRKSNHLLGQFNFLPVDLDIVVKLYVDFRYRILTLESITLLCRLVLSLDLRRLRKDGELPTEIFAPRAWSIKPVVAWPATIRFLRRQLNKHFASLRVDR